MLVVLKGFPLYGLLHKRGMPRAESHHVDCRGTLHHGVSVIRSGPLRSHIGYTPMWEDPWDISHVDISHGIPYAPGSMQRLK